MGTTAPDGLQADFSAGVSLQARVYGNFCRKLEHCRLDRDGAVVVRAGTRKCTASAVKAATCYGLRAFNDAGTQRLFALPGDASYVTANPTAAWTNISASGLTQNYADFATLKFGSFEYLIWANGTTARYYGNSSEGAVAGIVAGARFVRPFNGRLATATATTNLLYESAVDDFSVWAIPAALQLPIGDANGCAGLEVVGAGSTQHLLFFKKEQTARIDGAGNVDTVVAAGEAGESNSVGCVNFRTIKHAGDAGVMWLSRRGIELYADGAIRSVTSALAPFFRSSQTDLGLSAIGIVADGQTMAGSDLSGAHAYYDDQRQEYVLFILDQTGTYARVVVHVPSGACRLWPGGTYDQFEAVEMFDFVPPGGSTANRYPVGFLAGFPVVLEYGRLDGVSSAGTGGTSYTGTFRSRTMLFGVPNRRKQLREIRFVFRNDIGSPTNVSIFGVGGNVAGTTHTVSVGAGSPKEVGAGVSIRATDLGVGATFPPGIALLSGEGEANVLVQGRR